MTFVGRSNVGKSTLLNALCRKDLARVSNTPGRTRAINVFLAAPDRWLVDSPGYGFAFGDQAQRESWQAMIEGYLTGRAGMRMIFVLIDAKIGPTKLDLLMLKWLEAKNLPWRVVATKADQVKSSRALSQQKDVAHAMGLAPQDVAWVSADQGLGLGKLRGELCALLFGNP